MAGTTQTTEKRNLTYPIVKGIAYGMFGTGLALSVTDIYDLFHSTLGSTVITAAAVPMFIDGLQLIGRMARSHRFAESTRRTGFWVQMVGALVSLVANVVAGPSLGDKIGGAIFVIGYISMEAFAERLRPVTDDTAAQQDAEAAAKSAAASERARRAAATRAANKAKAAKAKRPAAPRAPKITKQDWAAITTAAPVSPAPAGTAIGYL